MLAARFSAGRLFPFGKSAPAPGEDPTFAFIRLRDESMTAGGTNDVRGWGDRMLGPKVPDVEANIEGTDTVLVGRPLRPDRGPGQAHRLGRAPVSGPGLCRRPGEASVFLDGGRVWTPDERFSQSLACSRRTPIPLLHRRGDELPDAGRRPRAQRGIQAESVAVDERDPGKVLDALIAGLPVDERPTDWLRRIHLHLSFGVAL